MMVWLFYRCRVSEKTSLQDAYHYDSSQDTRSETPRHNKTQHIPLLAIPSDLRLGFRGARSFRAGASTFGRCRT